MTAKGEPVSARETPPLDVLLLGGSGFIGRALLRAIDAENAAGRTIRVRALLRNPDAVPDFPWLTKLAGSLEHLPAPLEPNAPYVLVHFASKHIDRDGTGFMRTNVDANRALLAGLGPNLRGIVYSSSMSVYGQGAQDGVTEALLPAPETPLAQSRLLAEAAISGYAHTKGISSFLLRPRFVLGEGDHFVLPALAKLVKRRLGVGSGSQRFSIIGVTDYAQIVLDVTRQVIALHDEGAPTQTAYNVGYREPLSFAEIADTLASTFGLSTPRRQLRIPVSTDATRLLRRLPLRAADSLATRLELVGFSHWGDVSALADAVGPEIVEKDPRAVLRAAIATLKPARAH